MSSIAKKELRVLRDEDFELLKGQKIDNYYQFLSHFKYDIKKEELEGLRIDATGYSPDLARKLGEDYHKNHIIITTINQRDDVILRDENSSFRPLMNFTYSAQPVFDLINDITLREVLIGKVSCYYDRRFRRLFVELDLETPGNSIKRIKEIKNEIIKLKSDPYIMLSKARMEKLKKMISEPYDLSEKFPTLELINIPDGNVLPIRKSVECFRESTPGCDVYYFLNQRHKVIYFSHVKPNIYLGDDVDIFLSGENREQVLNVLFRHEYLTFKEDLTNVKLQQIAWESILGTVTSSSFCSEQTSDVTVSQKQLDTRVNEYTNIRNKITKDSNQNNMLFRELEFSVKKDLVEPKKHRREILEILSKLEPGNIIKMYSYDPRKFRERFSSSSDEEKTGILSRISSYVSYTGKHNQILNTWLAENHFKICKEAGIRFVV